jgi:hypothetical protein
MSTVTSLGAVRNAEENFCVVEMSSSGIYAEKWITNRVMK